MSLRLRTIIRMGWRWEDGLLLADPAPTKAAELNLQASSS
jgi:hypothetical protein